LELTTVTLLVHLIFFYYSFVNTRFYDPETNPTRSLDHGGTLYIHAFISLSYSVSRSLFDLIPSACNLTSETDSQHLNQLHACIHQSIIPGSFFPFQRHGVVLGGLYSRGHFWFLREGPSLHLHSVGCILGMGTGR